MQHRYAIGARVVYRPAFGTEPPVTVTIIETGEKNGRPLYDFDNGHWGYESQIICVAKCK
jgi:hypothetical protein